jgi:gliding motility-associated-like protein
MKNLLLILLMIVSFSEVCQCQQTPCPPNIDFETGTYSNWKFYTGTCCPIGSMINSGQQAGRHVLMTTANGTDQYGGFSVVAPNGGNYSLKLGNDDINSEAERARFTIYVPAGVNNYTLFYNYALVLEDPSHLASEQPRFELNIIDSNTNLPLPCGQYNYVIGANLPGFFLSTFPTAEPVWCKPWTTATLNLSGVAGHTVFADFSTGDCSLGGHFGYAYIDFSCNEIQIKTTVCNNAPTLTLTGPPGYAGYTWWDSSFSNVVATGQIATIPTPANPATIFYLALDPFPGFGCKDTLFSTLAFDTVKINNIPNQLFCFGDTLQLVAQGSGTSSVFNYSWTPTTSLSCNNCPNPVVSGLPATTTFVVTVSDTAGCSTKDTFKLTHVTPLYSSVTASLCDGNSLNGYTTTGIYIDTLYANSTGCDSIVTTNLTIRPVPKTYLNADICEGSEYLGYFKGGFYIDSFKASNGCDSIRYLTLTVTPKPTLSISEPGDICKGDTINLLASGAVNYKWFVNSSEFPRSTSSQFDLVINERQVIMLEGFDAKGCRNVLLKTYFEVPCCGHVAIPNAFSPNKDSKNELFRIKVDKDVENYMMQIFDRWGKELFRSSDLIKGWDGTFNGKAADIGSYQYLIHIKCKESQILKGDFLLIR